MDTEKEVNTTESMSSEGVVSSGAQLDASANMMSAPKKNKLGKKAKLVLLIAGVAVLVLVVVLIVVFVGQQGKEAEPQAAWSEQDEKVADIYEAIGQTFDEKGDVAELIESYNKEIDTAKADGDYSLVNRLIDDRSFSLHKYGYCDMAIESLKNEDVSMFEPEDLATFYNIAENVAISCKDNKNYEVWRILYSEASKEAGGIGV